jgi:hypothetical protein
MFTLVRGHSFARNGRLDRERNRFGSVFGRFDRKKFGQLVMQSASRAFRDPWKWLVLAGLLLGVSG